MNVVRPQFNRRVRASTSVRSRPVGRTYVSDRIAFAGIGLRDITFKLQELHQNDPAPFRIKRFFRDQMNFTKFRSSALKRSATMVEDSVAGHGQIKVEFHVDLPNTPENVGNTTRVIERFSFDATLASESEKAMARFIEFFDVTKHKPPYITVERIPAVGSFQEWTDRRNQVLFMQINHASLLVNQGAAAVNLTFQGNKSRMRIKLEELEAHSRLASVNGRYLVMNESGRFAIYNQETFNLRCKVM